MSRRSFVKGVALTAMANSALAQERAATSGTPTEWSYTTGKQYSDPFNEVNIDAVITLPSGAQERVPAFWGGGSTWRVRYAPTAPGLYRIRSACTDEGNKDLHNRVSTLQVYAYSGTNPHYLHGAIRVADDQRHFVYTDGTPFFWLGDTWWMGLCRRLSWPDDFQTLTADRARKGYSIVQIVAGLYPDMEPYDPRGANEAGYPWEPDFSRINPAYFDMADLRIQHLADSGIAACVVGFWGYFIPRMGEARVKQHWRYLIARWSAYPVVWCLAGEGTMPYYLSKSPEQDAQMQKHVLTELAPYVRATDPRHHVITIHPSSSARLCVEDPSVLDFDMLQTGHSSWRSVPNTMKTIQQSLVASPKMPVLVGEVCYEGIMQSSREEIQRFMFWASVLSGTSGHTYGANGLWQINNRDHPYGLSPHGHSWGGPSWQVAAQLPGSGQLGVAKKLLNRYSWWKLTPKLELVEPHAGTQDYWQPFGAEIPGEAFLVFCPTFNGAPTLHQLPPATYKAFFFNPSDGTEVPIGNVTPDPTGMWKGAEFPIFRDWVMVLEHKA